VNDYWEGMAVNYTSDEILEAVFDMFRRIASGEIRYPEEITIFPQLAEILLGNVGEKGPAVTIPHSII
jgi:hypothetical protein